MPLACMAGVKRVMRASALLNNLRGGEMKAKLIYLTVRIGGLLLFALSAFNRAGSYRLAALFAGVVLLFNNGSYKFDAPDSLAQRNANIAWTAICAAGFAWIAGKYNMDQHSAIYFPLLCWPALGIIMLGEHLIGRGFSKKRSRD